MGGACLYVNPGRSGDWGAGDSGGRVCARTPPLGELHLWSGPTILKAWAREGKEEESCGLFLLVPKAQAWSHGQEGAGHPLVPPAASKCAGGDVPTGHSWMM